MCCYAFVCLIQICQLNDATSFFIVAELKTITQHYTHLCYYLRNRNWFTVFI